MARRSESRVCGPPRADPGSLVLHGILWTGSRSSLVLLLGAILMLALLALINPGGLLARSRRLAFAGLLFLMPLGLLGLTHVLG
jgi:hypothetical protein